MSVPETPYILLSGRVKRKLQLAFWFLTFQSFKTSSEIQNSFHSQENLRMIFDFEPSLSLNFFGFILTNLMDFNRDIITGI